MKAFPINEIRKDGLIHNGNYGMDLRDYFAAKAMQAMITAQTFPTGIMIDTAK